MNTRSRNSSAYNSQNDNSYVSISHHSHAIAKPREKTEYEKMIEI
jgi:hypothetical protein